MKNKLLLILLTAVIVQTTTACEFKYKEFKSEEVDRFPKQIGLINDFENVLTKKQKEELEKILLDFQKNQKKNIIIASVKSFSPYTDFQKFSVDLGNNWNIRQNSLLIVISKDKRKIGLSLTKGIKGLSDEESKLVISGKIIPKFKENKYYDGIKSGVVEIISKWN